MGYLSGFTKGLGDYAQQMSQKQLELQTAGHKAMADLYSKLAENYQDNPEVAGEYLRRASAHTNAAANPFNKEAKAATKGLDSDPGEPVKNFINLQIHQGHQQLGIPTDKNALIDGGKGISGQLSSPGMGQSQSPASIPNKAVSGSVQNQTQQSQGQVPQTSPQMGQGSTQPPSPVQGTSGPQITSPSGNSGPSSGAPVPPTRLYDPNTPLPSPTMWSPMTGHSVPNPDFASQSGARTAYTEQTAKSQANLDYMRQFASQGGSGMRPVDQWRLLRSAQGDKEADQYRQGSWSDANGSHAHEMVTMSGARYFDRTGNEIPPHVPIDFAGPKYLFDQNNQLVDVSQVPQGVIGGIGISKPPVYRNSATSIDPWTGNRTTSSVTSYGSGNSNSGGVTRDKPQSVGSSTRTLTPPISKSSLNTSIHLETPLPAGTQTTTPDSNVPPEIREDPRFADAMNALINRKASLADYPPKVRGHLAALMPPDVRAAENSTDLQNLVAADKAMSLIQSRIQEVRAAAAPDKTGKSILDSITSRAAIAAILNPPPQADKPGIYGQLSQFVDTMVQGTVRGNTDPKVLNYTTKLRQLRDDILALRKFLGNAPMRSNSQMAIQLAQVPDATTSSYKDLDQLLSAFETTPTAAQGMQSGGRPSAPGTSTSIKPPNSNPSSGNIMKKFSPSTKLYYTSQDGGKTWQTSPTP